MKNRELVSRVVNGLHSQNKDASIPKRYILRVATDIAIFLMAQKFRDRSLFRESNLYRTVDCFELTSIDKYSCDIVEFRSSSNVMKSKEKLPELVHFKYGNSLKEVTNIDSSLDFKRTTPSKYRRDKRRQGFGKDFFFYVKDGYLYLPDTDVSRVALYLYSPNEYEILKSSSCNKQCLNPWDLEFICSNKIENVVISETIKEISVRVQIPEDENPNMDSNLKSKTTN
jgi:hypothetical protein